MAMNAIDKKISVVKLIFKVEKFDDKNETHNELTSFGEGENKKVFSNLDQFKEAYSFKALQQLQESLTTYIEANIEAEKLREEQEAEKARLAEEEAKAQKAAEFELLKQLAKLQLPTDKQNDESAINAKAKDLFSAMLEPQSVQESDSKIKRSYNAVQFKTLLIDDTGTNIVRSLTGRRSPEVKALISDSDPIWKIVHEDDADKLIDYAKTHNIYKTKIDEIKSHFKK